MLIRSFVPRRAAVVCAAVGVILLAAAAPHAWAADWPAYQADSARSAAAGEVLSLPLVKVWSYAPAQPPRPAWPEPGKELHRMDFDYAFQPVAAGGRVYFGSSADDTVRCLDAGTGRVIWQFTAGGPVRFAPAIAAGRCTFACDDGWAYCLDAATGEPVWTFRAAPRGDQILGNGRMISRWPLRTGVVVDGGVAYLTAGMWPQEGVYVYALDAATGRRLWCNDGGGTPYMQLPHRGASAFTGICPQGYLLAGPDVLLVPTGRSVPAAFDRKTGRLLYYNPAANHFDGGSWATLAGRTYYSPAHGQQIDEESFVGQAQPLDGDGMNAYDLADGKEDTYVRLPNKHLVLASGANFYAAGDGSIQSIDLARRRQDTGSDPNSGMNWLLPHGRAYSLALAGTTLLVGGAGTISAVDAAGGKRLWLGKLDGEVRGLAVADGRVLAATDRGEVACFAPNETYSPTLRVRDRLTWHAAAPGREGPLAGEIARAAGVSAGYALVVGQPDARLGEALAMRTDLHVICLLADPAAVAAERRRLLTTDLYGTRVVVHAAPVLSSAVPPPASGPAERGASPAAKRGELADAPPSAALPYASYFADLVVVAPGAAGPGASSAPAPASAPVPASAVPSAAELYRVLRPCGGVMCLAGMSGGQAMKFASPHVSSGDELIYGGELTLLRRGALAGAGEWRSQWGSYAQTGVGAETLVHLPLEMLWFGGPGPDRMLDRHWGTTTPLSVGGRVFVTGQNHVLCVDAYNGREWWSRPIREVARRNAAWNTGGMVADDDSLYVAKEGICLRLDQATGKTLAIYRVPSGAVRGASAGDEPSLPPVDVAWPTAWRTFGPVPSTVPLLDGNDLKTIPAELPAGGVRYPARPLAVAGGVLDFTNLYGGYGFAPLAAGEKPGPFPRGKGKRDYDTVEKAVYVMAEIRCEKAGKLTIGAGCDWWMAWYLDGKRIFDTLKGGNDLSPNQITDHVFSTNVTAGPHVLAVLVRAGSAGWSLASAGGSKYEPQITGGFGAAGPEWGAIMVLGQTVLGTCVEKGSSTGEASSLFALGRDDGAVRWIRHARGAVLHAGLAAGEGKLFVLEAPLREDLWKVRRRGMSADANQVLTALDGETGKELWQRKGVRSGRLDTVQYAQGTVVVGGSKAYAASGGQPLWEDKEGDYRASARPVIVNGRIITHPDGVDLRTGRPLMIADPLTGLPRPWKYVRAYGCGSVVGSQDVLLFRSGMMGFLDLLQDGTTTYGGLKPNCSVNMIAAGGLVIVPEGASGCSCSYNFQTSIALAPVTARAARPTTGPATAPAAAAAANQPWYVFYGQSPEGPVKQLRVSFGSPGDRRRGSETWLGWPRPSVRGAQPAPITVGPMDPNYVHAAADCSAVRGEAPAWVYASHLAGACTIAVSVWGEGRSSEYDDFSGTMVPQWGTRSTTGGPAAPSTASAPAGPVERSFTVRLHFLEPSDLPVGARTFDVSIQGRCLLPAFDIVKSAGAPRRAVVAEIKGIRADRTLNIELKSRKGTPILSGLEVLAEP